MPRKLLFVAATLILLAVTLFAVNDKSREASADVGLDSEEQTFITLLNDWRAQNGAGPIAISTTITNASEWMNNDMGVNHYFSHTDSLGRNPWDRMCAFGYCYNTWKGENIAAGYSTAQSVFTAWKGSPGHNANMLNANYKVMGLSRLYVSGSDYGWYWTNDFGGYVETAPPPAPTATPAPTPVPTPAPPPGFGCTSDFDCDGWTDAIEARVGTSSTVKCSATLTKNDESPDALPADFNDDRWVNGADLLSFNSKFGTAAARWDLNADGTVSGVDVLMLNALMGKKC